MLLYDLPIGKSAASIKESYKLRKRYLNHRIHFKQGNSGEEKACIKAIKQLILGQSLQFMNPLLPPRPCIHPTGC